MLKLSHYARFNFNFDQILEFVPVVMAVRAEFELCGKKNVNQSDMSVELENRYGEK